MHYDVISPNKVEFERITQALHVSADILDERIIEQVRDLIYSGILYTICPIFGIPRAKLILIEADYYEV